jgi:hypothetical protein
VVPFTVTTSFYPVLLKNLGMSAASISLLATVRVGSVALGALDIAVILFERIIGDLRMLGGLYPSAGIAAIGA